MIGTLTGAQTWSEAGVPCARLAASVERADASPPVADVAYTRAGAARDPQPPPPRPHSGDALIVGTDLFVINHSDTVLSGAATTAMWVKTGITYLGAGAAVAAAVAVPLFRHEHTRTVSTASSA